MYLLGYDIGSSSVKASLLDAETGKCVASDFFPKKEMPIKAIKKGWAEQDPNEWWEHVKSSTLSVLDRAGAKSGTKVKAIGISYQMHGLVCVDKQQQPLRPSIIWCDSRAVSYGEKAFEALGSELSLNSLLNSPGNFTASKLAWVKENEPALFEKIDKIMLPGDYIAMKLTGESVTTLSGLSEGMFWNFRHNRLSTELMEYFGFDPSIISTVRPTFGLQGEVSAAAASELGLPCGTPVTYRAGDQPNNALSLNVLNPGEVAATAGTSGVVYGVNGHLNYDPQSRVNTFAHVNHTHSQPRLGVLLCINGTGILNSWIKHNAAPDGMDYKEMDAAAAQIPIGSDGVTIVPFGNGAERMLNNRAPGASIHGLNFNIHTNRHLMRAAQEGIVFSFVYGMEIMHSIGIDTKIIRAGFANMFMSDIFSQTLAGTSDAVIELYDTDGSIGAARGAGIGAGIYRSPAEAFASLKKIKEVEPNTSHQSAYRTAYEEWKKNLNTATGDGHSIKQP